jgi:hypothetical protein
MQRIASVIKPLSYGILHVAADYGNFYIESTVSHHFIFACLPILKDFFFIFP